MRRRLLVLLLIATVAAGCGGGKEESLVMPDVIGKRLDVAMSDMAAAGLTEEDVEVVGGGALGVLDESNWTVCEQNPTAGADANDAKNVRVIVDRVCGAESSGEDPGTASPPTEDTAAPSSTTESTPTTASTPQEDPDAVIAVPNVVGMDLQLAQDMMQGAGFFHLTSHDATGQDRLQVVDRGWKVCSQTPPGGSEANSTTQVDFGVVRNEEACP